MSTLMANNSRNKKP